MLFVGGAVATAAGCSSSNSSSASGGSTLNVWYHQYGEKGTQQAAIRYAEAFTKANPDIAVKVTWVPGDYVAKLNASLLTANAPDVFEIGDFDAPMARRGQIAPLDDLYGAAQTDFAPSALSYVTVDGKLYGIQMMRDLMMVYYRKSMFAKARITPPKTFDDLRAAAKALTTGSQKGLFVGNDGVGQAGYLQLWASGGDLVTGGKAAFASPQAVEALGALKQLADDKSLLLGFTTDWWDETAFTTGAAAMQLNGLWSMPAVTKALGDDFGVIPWPAYGSAGTPSARVGGWATVVNAKGKHVAAAKKYAQWLWIDQADFQKDWAVGYGFHIPARESIAAATDQLKQGAAKDAVDIADSYGKVFPNVWNSAPQTHFGDAMAKIVAGNGDPAQLLKDAAGLVQTAIDKQSA
jgi:multiple sugar transport system substrate-binding protein